MAQIRRAQINELERVKAFYDMVIDAMEGAQYAPAWQKDIYPSKEDLSGALSRGELYVGERDGDIVSAMVVNRTYNEGYNGAPWRVAARPDEVTVVHMLCTHPDCARQGLGRELVAEAIDIAKKRGDRVMRLDVLRGNLPAGKLYAGMGFEYIKTVNMFYEDTGWVDFELYEYVL